MPALRVEASIRVKSINGDVMNKYFARVIKGLSLLFLSNNTYATESHMDSANLFDSILTMFHNTAHTWGHTITNYASWLFWTLALISMVWTYGFMALQKADLQEFFRETIRFIVTLGFFFWLLMNGPLIATAIVDSLRLLAANASGVSQHISPSSIVDVGFDIVSKATDNSSIWSPAATIVGLIVAGVILVILTLVGLNMLIILISAWIITYGGIFLLGFGGGRWTQEIAINYYRSILGIALQAFAMILIMGIGKSFIDQYYALMSKDILLKEMFIMLAVAITLLTLINTIPPKLAGLVHGSGGFGGGGGGPLGGGIGLGGAMGAVGVAGAAAAAGMGAASAHGAGGVSALGAAFKAASQSVAADSGMSVMSGAQSTTKLGGLAAAMGMAGKFAGTFGSHLASGTADVAKEKLGTIKNAISGKVSETAGGKVASAIADKAASNGASDEASTEPTSQSSSTKDSPSANVTSSTVDSGCIESASINESAQVSEASDGDIDVSQESKEA